MLQIDSVLRISGFEVEKFETSDWGCGWMIPATIFVTY